MELKLILEAVLFSAQKALSLKELREVLAEAVQHAEGNEAARAFKKVKEEALTTALEELAREVEAAGRSYRLVCVAGAGQVWRQPGYAPLAQAVVAHQH